MNGIVSKFLFDNLYLTLATVCKNGKPWSTPLFFAFDGNFIYWWSPKDAVHSQNIARNANVFITVFDSRAPEGAGEGIYLDCEAHEITDRDEMATAINAYNSRAKKFELTEKLNIAPAPTRIYKAKICNAWTNSDREENGYYVDIRENIS